MIKKYISKFTIDIMPSIIATIVGAYIVNHYIVPKSADAPAAATASVDSKPAAPALIKASVKPTENTSDVASLPDAAAALPADKPATDLKTDTSSAAARRHQPTAREKAAAEKAASEKAAAEKAASEKAASEKAAAEKAAARPAATAAVTPAAPAPAPSIASVIDAAPTPSPGDANDLARAAIERLRNSGDAPRIDGPRVQEAVRVQEAPHLAAAPPAQQSAIQQLPPPIMVSTPNIETYGTQPLSGQPAYSDAPRSSDARGSRRLRPPGDIPLGPPLNIEADATGSTPRQNTTTVADDVLSAAKSVFHSVIPHQFDH